MKKIIMSAFFAVALLASTSAMAQDKKECCKKSGEKKECTKETKKECTKETKKESSKKDKK